MTRHSRWAIAQMVLLCPNRGTQRWYNASKMLPFVLRAELAA